MADAPQYLDAQGNPITPRQAATSSAPRTLNAQGQPIPEGPPRSWTDTAVDALPMVGGMVGGALGSLTGIPTLGLGAVPGAIAGAGMLGAGGDAARQLINRVRGQAAPPTMTDAATSIGTQGGLQAAMEGAGQAVMPALNAGATAVYRGYLKPSLSRVNLPKAARIVRDAISEGIPITQGGLQRADALISELNGKVNTLLSQATGRTVDLGEIADQVRAWAQRTFDRPGRDPRDYKAALAVADRIDQHPSVNPASLGNQMAGKTSASVDMATANQVKRDLQRSAADKFGVPTGSAETATEKYASARMRQGIEAQVPEVGPLNARQQRLIDVARTIARATGREANKSPLIGVNTLASAAVGGEEYGRTGDPASAAAKALALRMALTPAVATRAAIVAAQLAAKIPGTAVADVARVAVQAASESQKESDGGVEGH